VWWIFFRTSLFCSVFSPDSEYVYGLWCKLFKKIPWALQNPKNTNFGVFWRFFPFWWRRHPSNCTKLHQYLEEVFLYNICNFQRVLVIFSIFFIASKSCHYGQKSTFWYKKTNFFETSPICMKITEYTNFDLKFSNFGSKILMTSSYSKKWRHQKLKQVPDAWKSLCILILT